MTPSAILYVEDEDTDVLLVRFALQRAGLLNPLKRVANGEEAIDYLAGKGNYSNRAEHPFPGLVLLDLNLPRLSGFEVLRWVRQQSQFHSMAVVVYSSSNLETDRSIARLLGATDYYVKLSDINQVAALMREIARRLLPGC